MITFLQINLQRSWTAQTLFHQYIVERNIDVCILSEQHSDLPTTKWIADSTVVAAIWITNPNISVLNSGNEDGFVWVKTPFHTVFSCYLSPNEGPDIFRHKLAKLEDAVRETEGESIIAGDFNAKSVDWGMSSSDSRGDAVSDMIARLDHTIINRGNTSTFRRAGCRESILDITFASSAIAAFIAKWAVLEIYSASDHQMIEFTTTGPETRRSLCSTTQQRRWNDKKLDPTTLVKFLSLK
ncbi:uncharacterized protein LOC103575846 [Microplitis demolitor]|uniref:uncharacterized protein LOC103575846 n=1 Tax=Microplitis demolitor TaxID=69319 RepID=UPI0004CD5E41|nr:uncharacterized protein LOC103575846 [Microplitis demolitor]